MGIPGGRYTRGSGYTRVGGMGIPESRYTRGGMYTHPPPDMGSGIPTLPPRNPLPVLATTTHVVGKQVLCILLEYCLVLTCDFSEFVAQKRAFWLHSQFLT